MSNDNNPASRMAPRCVAMLVYEGCASLDVSGPLEVFGFTERWLRGLASPASPIQTLSAHRDEPSPSWRRPRGPAGPKLSSNPAGEPSDQAPIAPAQPRGNDHEQ